MAQNRYNNYPNNGIGGRIRPATWDDQDDLGWVLANAASGDPNYPYRYPSMHHRPEAFALFCKQKCLEYLHSDVVHAYVVPDDRDPRVFRVVAFCIWERHDPVVRQGLGTPHAALQRSNATNAPLGRSRASMRDERPDRICAFRDNLAAAKASFFDSRYTDGYYYLKLLLCHPQYQRRGIGTTLVKWGIEQARQEGLRAALFSSPMGYSLYKRLGFREKGRVPIQVPGDDKSLDIPAMTMKPRGTFRRDTQVLVPPRRRYSIAV